MNTLLNSETLGGVGAPTLDIEIAASAPFTGEKATSKISVKPGGGHTNALRQAKRLGATVEPIFLIGADSQASLLKRLLREEFPNATFLRGLAATRISVLYGGRCHTTRPTATIQKLPTDLQDMVRNWSMALQGPMSAADFPLAEHVASLAKRTVLQLSGDQLRFRERSRQLVEQSWLAVLNRDELRLLTNGQVDPVAGIQQLRSGNVNNLLITGRDGVLGFAEGQWIHRPSYAVDKVRHTIGAGDAFVGTVMAARAANASWSESAKLGMAASAILVEGGEMPTSLAALQEIAWQRKTIPAVSSPVTRRGKVARVVTSAAALAGVGVGIAGVWLST